MVQTPLRTLLALTVSATLLTACNKAETPKTDTANAKPAASATSASTPAVATASATTVSTSSAKSKTVDMYVTTFKMATVGLLNTKKPLTKEQTQCLLSADSNASYYNDAQAELTKMIGADGIAESDKFYDTEVGKKMLAFIEQQQAQAMGQPITGTPIVITEADKKAAADFTANNPKMKEIQAKMEQATSNQQTMMEKMKNFAAKEQTRCKIS